MPGKTYVDENGYRRFTDSDMPVHRWVAEQKLGRKLKPWEVVHHKDRDKLNNDPDNLWVFRNQEEHDEAHEIDAMRHGPKASYQGFDKDDDQDNDRDGSAANLFVSDDDDDDDFEEEF